MQQKFLMFFFFLGKWYNKNVTHFVRLNNNSWHINKFILFSKKDNQKKKKKDNRIHGI